MKILRSAFLCAVICCAIVGNLAAKDARVTQIFREVNLLPADEAAHAASMNDRVPENTAVRTGDRSRSELTFADLTITRLGANSIYSQQKSGRAVELSGGSILLRVPKDSGGANISAPAVTVAVTGTTLILESARGGRSKLIVLEGAARLGLRANSSQKKIVHAGQMLEVPAGATALGEPEGIDLRRVMETHPLIVGFPALPSRNLIDAVMDGRNAAPVAERVYQGQPVNSGSVAGGSGVPFFPVGGLPNFGGGRQGGSSVNDPSRPPTRGAKPPPRTTAKPTPTPPIIR